MHWPHGMIVLGHKLIERFRYCTFPNYAHRHNVAILGIGASDKSTDDRMRSTLFIVMEYLGGGSLKTLVMEQMVEWGVRKMWKLFPSSAQAWTSQNDVSISQLPALFYAGDFYI